MSLEPFQAWWFPSFPVCLCPCLTTFQWKVYLNLCVVVCRLLHVHNLLSKGNIQRTLAQSRVGLSVPSQRGLTLLCSPWGKQELRNSSPAPKVSWAAAEMGAWARAAAQPSWGSANNSHPPALGQGFPWGLSQGSLHQHSWSIHETKAQSPTNTGAAQTHWGQAGRALAELNTESCSFRLKSRALDCDVQLQCLAGNIFTMFWFGF